MNNKQEIINKCSRNIIEAESIYEVNKEAIDIINLITKDLFSMATGKEIHNINEVKKLFIDLINQFEEKKIDGFEEIKTTITYKNQEIRFEKLLKASMELVETSFYPYYIEGISFNEKNEVIDLLKIIYEWYVDNCILLKKIKGSASSEAALTRDDSYLVNNDIKESKFIYGPTVNLRIKSNPFKKENLFYVSDKPYFRNLSKKYKNKYIGDVNIEFIKDIANEFINSEVTITFEGSKYDFEDLSVIISNYNKESQSKIKLVPGTLIYDLNRTKELKHLRHLIENSDIDNLKDKNMLEYFDMYLEENNSVCVLATMSSGKSTLNNSIIGTKLMPSKNEACTAKIMHLKNNNMATCFTDKSGNVVTNDTLKQVNDDQGSDINIYLEGPIRGFSDIDNFEIIDTPGPNNSQDESHREITYNFIKSDKKHMVIVVLDGTKLLTTDEANFMSIIAREQGEDGNIDNDRFLFVINKADGLDEDDSEVSMKDKVIKALQGYGIENPKVQFVSALNALLARNKQNNIKMTVKENYKLDFITNISAMGEYKFYEFSDLSPAVRDEVNKRIEEYKRNEDNLNLVIATSGILGLELTIKEYMNKHKNIRKVKNVVKVCKNTINRNDLMQDIRKIVSTNVKERQALEKSILILDKKISDDKQINELKKEINSIKFGDSLSKIEKNINAEFISFKKEIDALPFEVVNGKKIVNTTKANDCIKKLQNKYEDLRADLISELSKSIKKDVTNVIDNTIKKYRVYIKSLCNDITYNNEINIGEFVNASTPDFVILAKSCVIKETLEKVNVIENPKKKGFWGKLCFWRDNYVNVTTYHDKKGIEVTTIIKFLSEARADISKLYTEIKQTREEAKQKCLGEINSQVNEFNNKIKLDLKKLATLRECVNEKNNSILEAEKEMKRKVMTIKNIKQKLDSVMAI